MVTTGSCFLAGVFQDICNKMFTTFFHALGAYVHFWHAVFTVVDYSFSATDLIYRFCNLKCSKWRKKRDDDLFTILTNINSVPQHMRETEEEINRNFNPLFQEICNAFGKPISTMLTGSSAEGFNIPLSGIVLGRFSLSLISEDSLFADHDFLMFARNELSSFERDSADYFVETDVPEVKPGFAKIYRKASELPIPASQIKSEIYNTIMSMSYNKLPFYHDAAFSVGDSTTEVINIPIRVGERTYCEKWYEELEVGQHGPAICISINSSTGIYMADFTYSIQCKEWPGDSDWLTRDREWPEWADVQHIASHGFHLVPKSQPDDKEGLTWRFSFSQAEVELSKLINLVARKCFVALKIIYKDFLKSHKIKSYHLKTIFFNYLEKTDESLWHPDIIVTSFDLRMP